MKKIYIVTHGETFSGSNPEMTSDGYARVEALRPLLPAHPALVICGTGNRHLNALSALKLEVNSPVFTPAVGGSESLENGVIFLANGIAILRTSYYAADEYARVSMLFILGKVPNDTIICSEMRRMVMFGTQEAQPAAVYSVSFADAPTPGSLRIEEIRDAGILRIRMVLS